MIVYKNEYIDILGKYIQDVSTQEYDISGINCITFANEAVKLMSVGEFDVIKHLGINLTGDYMELMSSYIAIGGREAIKAELCKLGAVEVSKPARGDLVFCTKSSAIGIMFTGRVMFFGRNGLTSSKVDEDMEFLSFLV